MGGQILLQASVLSVPPQSVVNKTRMRDLIPIISLLKTKTRVSNLNYRLKKERPYVSKSMKLAKIFIIVSVKTSIGLS